MTAYPSLLLLAVCSFLLAGDSQGFATTSRATTIIRNVHHPSSLTKLRVNNDPLDEYDLEYAYRGDDYGYNSNDYNLNAISNNDYYDDVEPLQENRALIDLVNTVLRVLYNSFKNVEDIANGLLKEQPVLAFGIFIAAGMVAAYLLGFLILDGCIESWNPVNNGMVPYWDEEIHVMVRRIH